MSRLLTLVFLLTALIYDLSSTAALSDEKPSTAHATAFTSIFDGKTLNSPW